MGLKDKLTKAAETAKRVKVKETTLFGEQCWIRMISAKQRDRWEASQFNCNLDMRNGQTTGKATLNMENLRARLVVLGLSEEDGTQIFSETNPKDLEEVGNWSADEMDRLYDEILEFNHMTPKAIEDAEKNSIPAQA